VAWLSGAPNRIFQILTENYMLKLAPQKDDVIIQAVARDVENLLTHEGSGHDWQHIRRVWRTAVQLADIEGANQTVVALAALLHDVDDRKLTGDPTTAERLPTARRILAAASVDPVLSETVCKTIKMTGFHKSLDGVQDRTLEAHILSDSDQLDAIGAVGIARTFVYGASKKRSMFDPDSLPMEKFTAAEYDANMGSTVNHFFEKLLRLRGLMFTQAGKVEANTRHGRMVSFLDDFFDESFAPTEWTDLLNKFRPGSISEELELMESRKT
jgi:uncharacterized protein